MPDSAETGAPALLGPRAIVLDATASDKEEAIRLTGQVLVDIGAVEASYVDAMLEREESVSTFMGSGVAIPHGTVESKDTVHRDALSFVRFDAGVDWNGNNATIAIGIAAAGNSHIGILSKLAMVLVDAEAVAALNSATDPQEVIDLLQPTDDDEDEEDR